VTKGISTRTTSLGFHVLRLHYSSDRDKDPATEAGRLWMEQAKAGMSDARWRKEYEIDYGALSGQNAQSSSTQGRQYWFDDLGRMIQELNPETGSGMSLYTYDSDSTCGTSKGDLVKRQDQVGDVICYTYDAAHRLTSMYVYSGTYASVSAYRYLIYDSATVNGVSMSNAKARLAEAYTSSSSCPSPCSSKITDEGFSYDARGDLTDEWESTPHSGTPYYHVTQSYFANGAPNALSTLSGLPTITYSVDGEGRMYSASASAGQNPLTSTIYNTASEPTTVTLGSGDTDSFQYDSNSDRMTQYKFTINGSSVVGNLTWNPNGTLEQLAITDPFNSADGQTCNYTHDDLSRIATASCSGGSTFSDTYTYDAFGNLTKSGTETFNASYNSATNQMTSIGGQTPTYDANGNVKNDFLNSYSWDAYGRPVTVDTVGLTFDALGRMVEQNKSGSYTEVVYGATGNELAFMSGQSLSKAYVSLSHGDVAVVGTSGVSNYHHMDWQGSFRLASNTSRTVVYDTAYGPYGELYATSGSYVPAFTGPTQDTASNVYDFPAREYGIQGRWPSPDPAGMAAVNPMDPQTWNRYAYVRNSPLSMIDPFGFDDIPLSKIILGSDTTCGLACWPNPFELSFTPGAGFEMSMFGNITFGPNPFSGGGGSSGTPQAPTPQQTPAQQCVSDFQNSTVGKVVSFGSVLNFFNSLVEWVGFGGAKLVGVKALDTAETSASVAQYSITAGSTTEPAALVGSKVLGYAGMLGMGAATAADIQVRATCHVPSLAGVGMPIVP
jgi:RHS repeat-associated protein